MLAYNLLFFFPMIFLAAITSLTALIISIIRLAKNKSTNKSTYIISICLSTPVILYVLWTIAIIIIGNHFDNDDSWIIPEPTFNNDLQINNNGEKDLYLVGYKWGRELKNKRVYISLTPYECDTFNIIETYCYQGSDSLEVLYQNINDSVYIYINEKYGFYTHYGAKYLEQIPVRNFRLSDNELDSIIHDKKNLIKKFIWE